MNTEIERVAFLAEWHVKEPHTRLDRMMIRTWGQETREWEPGECRVCRRPVDAGPVEYPVTVCDACEPVVREHYAEREGGQPAEQGERFEDICPELWRKMLTGEIVPSYVDEDAHRKALGWHPSEGRGMVLVGPSGTGKTLTLWTLKRELMSRGIRCDFWTAIEITRELGRHAKDLDAARHLWNTRVLMVDDLGKEALTPSGSALWWELIDRRYQSGSPTILTTRFVGDQFESRFREPGLGGDIRRRIADTCRVVPFRAEDAVKAVNGATSRFPEKVG